MLHMFVTQGVLGTNTSYTTNPRMTKAPARLDVEAFEFALVVTHDGNRRAVSLAGWVDPKC